MIQKILESHRIVVGQHQSFKFPGRRVYSPGNVFTNMIACVIPKRFWPFFRPNPPRTSVVFNAGLVEKPNITQGIISPVVDYKVFNGLFVPFCRNCPRANLAVIQFFEPIVNSAAANLYAELFFNFALIHFPVIFSPVLGWVNSTDLTMKSLASSVILAGRPVGFSTWIDSIPPLFQSLTHSWRVVHLTPKLSITCSRLCPIINIHKARKRSRSFGSSVFLDNASKISGPPNFWSGSIRFLPIPNSIQDQFKNSCKP